MDGEGVLMDGEGDLMDGEGVLEYLGQGLVAGDTLGDLGVADLGVVGLLEGVRGVTAGIISRYSGVLVAAVGCLPFNLFFSSSDNFMYADGTVQKFILEQSCYKYIHL